MLPLLRYFILPFSLSVLVFTACLNNYRAEEAEWLIMTAHLKSAEFRRNPLLFILYPERGSFYPLPTQKNAYVHAVTEDGQWLYFDAIAEHKYRGSHYARDIYRMPLNNFGKIENLTQDEFIDNLFSSFSSDGEWIYYSSENAFAPTGNWRSFYNYATELDKDDLAWWDVFRMRVDGSEPERLTYDHYQNHWFLGEIGNADQLLIGIFTRYNTAELYGASYEGGYEYVLVDGEITFWDISPDKKWIYYASREWIYGGNDNRRTAQHTTVRRVHWDGYHEEILTKNTLEDDQLGIMGTQSRFIANSPNYQWLYFRDYQPSSRDWEVNQKESLSNIYRIASDYPSKSVIIANDSFAWGITPDNQWLYYAQNGNRIYRLNTTTQVYEELSELNEYNYFLSFSGDGEWLYFRSTEGENAYLYKMRLDGSELRQLADISELNMCIYPDRCQDNLFVVNNFGMRWHPNRVLLSMVGTLGFFLVAEMRMRMQRRKQFAKGEFAHV